MPRCRAGGRYHVPPWVVPLILDKSGDALLPIGNGEYEGRAAFFDLSLDGRWGGGISGDRISIDFSPCPSGHKGPSIRDTTARYAELERTEEHTSELKSLMRFSKGVFCLKNKNTNNERTKENGLE